MPEYLAPGVYVEEVATGARPIQAVGTSTAGFVGIAPNPQAHVNELLWFNHWTEFVRALAPPGSSNTPLGHAVYGFFQNGGSRCCVVNVGPDGGVGGEGREGLGLLEQAEEVAVVGIPGFTDAGSYEAALAHCERMKDRVAVLDGPSSVSSIDSLTKVATAARTRSKKGGGDTEGQEPNVESGLRPRPSDGGYGAYYFPWITVRDPLAPKQLADVAPSGHVAGIYARTDATRGVHKAPANEVIRGALNVSYHITRQEQAVLNPQGVNCICLFPREGIRVFGGRTVAAGSSEWRYLNVRRLFNMVEKSIAQSTRWVVFEPNDRPLWKAITRDVSAFLTLLWRQGALMGRTPEEAFFVQCDEETNPPEVIDAGQLVTVIGLAPVKPAEFVIFRIGQSAAGAEIESQT